MMFRLVFTTTARTRTLAALTAVATVIGASGAAKVGAQTVTTGTTQELGLKTPGAPQGYAILKPAYGTTTPEVGVTLKPDSQLPAPETWTWHVDESDAQIKSAVTLRWYAQASCPDALTDLRVSGPAGTLVQNPLINPISGYFKTQNFTTDTIRNVCTNWANSHQCDILTPGNGCPLQETFELTGGILPSGPADRLRLRASCATGQVADTYYSAKIRLTCTRGIF